MPGSATDYLETKALQHTLGIVAMPFPAAIYLALTISAPDDATPGSEVGIGGYARQRVSFDIEVGNTDIAANVATVEFPAATAGWGNVGWFELWDALTSGNRLYWGPLVDPTDGTTPLIRAVLAGDIVRFTAGTIQVQAS
jgi:hypothetical protein